MDGWSYFDILKEVQQTPLVLLEKQLSVNSLNISLISFREGFFNFIQGHHLSRYIIYLHYVAIVKNAELIRKI